MKKNKAIFENDIEGPSISGSASAEAFTLFNIERPELRNPDPGRSAGDIGKGDGVPAAKVDSSIHALLEGASGGGEIAMLADPALDTLAHQLTDGYWEAKGGGRRSFDIAAGGTLKVDIGDLAAPGKKLAKMALDAWTDAVGIKFKVVNKNADITFDDNKDGAYSTSKVRGDTIRSSHVNIDTDWIDAYGKGKHTYSMQTYVHEIGHALGLGHAGNYNGNATYDPWTYFENDSWQASIMSYFSQDDNWLVDADFALVMTPQVADILAMRDLYGTTGIRGGDSRYSFAADFKAGTARTIVDTGGIDTLDLSWSKKKQFIDLNEDSFSTVNGLTGNLGIARGTVIEIAVGGSNKDTIVGNDYANALFGRGGKDRLEGGGGEDLFVFDTMPGKKNVDRIVDFTPGEDMIVLDNKTFRKAGADGALSADAFVANESGRATDAGDRLIYDIDSGALYYDENGSARGGAVKIAQLGAWLDLDASDFHIL